MFPSAAPCCRLAAPRLRGSAFRAARGLLLCLPVGLPGPQAGSCDLQAKRGRRSCQQRPLLLPCLPGPLREAATATPAQAAMACRRWVSFDPLARVRRSLRAGPPEVLQSACTPAGGGGGPIRARRALAAEPRAVDSAKTTWCTLLRGRSRATCHTGRAWPPGTAAHFSGPGGQVLGCPPARAAGVPLEGATLAPG